MIHPIWQNKIVRYVEEAPDQLLANPANFRLHPKNQQDALSGVLDDVGWISPIICNEVSGHVIDGHLRVTLALRNNLPTVPVIYVHLTPAEEAEALATYDPLSAMAGTDSAQLDALLREVSTDSPAVQAMLDVLATEAGIVPGEPVDPTELWKGMPEFEQEDVTAPYSIRVLFDTERDMANFAKLIGQTITDKTTSIYFPKHERKMEYEFSDDNQS